MSDAYGFPQHGRRPVGPAGQPAWTAPAPPSPSRTGELSLLLALVALLVSSVLSALGGGALRRLEHEVGPNWNEPNIPPHLHGAYTTLLVTLAGQLLPLAIGLVAVGVGIAALRRASSRGYGVAGLITTLVAPVLSFVLFGWLALS